MSIRKIRQKKILGVRVVGGRLHALEEGKEIEVNDIPAGSDKPRLWYKDVDGKEIGIKEDEAELIED